jgi:hypothetical protein
VDLDNAINELLLRLEDHKYRWSSTNLGLLMLLSENGCAIIDHLQVAVHTGTPRTFRSEGGRIPPYTRRTSTAKKAPLKRPRTGWSVVAVTDCPTDSRTHSGLGSRLRVA